jgi:Abortive infection alpha
MTEDSNLIPISDEQAKAVQEALKTLQGLGGFLKATFGTVPQDVVGLLGGDYLRVRRAENLFRTMEKAKKRLEDGHVKQPDAPPSLALPIMIAAADETRDGLQNVWAALLAAAADPDKNRSFRLKFIEVAKNMDPIDALILEQLRTATRISGDDHGAVAMQMHITLDEIEVSIDNLRAQGLIQTDVLGSATATPLGREFLRTVGVPDSG